MCDRIIKDCEKRERKSDYNSIQFHTMSQQSGKTGTFQVGSGRHFSQPLKIDLPDIIMSRTSSPFAYNAFAVPGEINRHRQLPAVHPRHPSASPVS